MCVKSLIVCKRPLKHWQKHNGPIQPLTLTEFKFFFSAGINQVIDRFNTLWPLAIGNVYIYVAIVITPKTQNLSISWAAKQFVEKSFSKSGKFKFYNVNMGKSLQARLFCAENGSGGF